MTLGTLAYIQDYDGIYPVSTPAGTGLAIRPVGNPDAGGFGPITRSTWFIATQPYIKNYQILKCPSTVTDTDLGYGNFQTNPWANGIYVSYMPNGYLNAWSEAESSTPAQVIMYSGVGKKSYIASYIPFPALSDSAISYANTNGGTVATFKYFGAGCTTIGGVYLNTIDSSWYVHGEGDNYAYMDGHVKWLRTAGPGTAFSRVSANGEPLIGTTYYRRALQTGGGACIFFRAYAPFPGQDELQAAVPDV
jgi:prepilin-type processing-associated H-X9-DG protein